MRSLCYGFLCVQALIAGATFQSTIVFAQELPSGRYYIKDTTAEFGYAGSYLSFDTESSTRANVTIEKNDKMQWDITRVGPMQYRITSAYGGPSTPFFGSELSIDYGSRSIFLSSDKSSNVTWQIFPVIADGYYTVCLLEDASLSARSPFVNWGLSWTRSNPLHPGHPNVRMHNNNSFVQWYITTSDSRPPFLTSERTDCSTPTQAAPDNSDALSKLVLQNVKERILQGSAAAIRTFDQLGWNSNGIKDIRDELLAKVSKVTVVLSPDLPATLRGYTYLYSDTIWLNQNVSGGSLWAAGFHELTHATGGTELDAEVLEKLFDITYPDIDGTNYSCDDEDSFIRDGGKWFSWNAQEKTVNFQGLTLSIIDANDVPCFLQGR